MGEYQSSEEIQRANRDTFVDKAAKDRAQETRSEKDKIHAVLDKYVKKHGSTKSVREMATENKRDANYQLDLSADLVDILEKIKNELR